MQIGFMMYGCYGLLLVFGLIGILNLVNTMINSVYVRRRELACCRPSACPETDCEHAAPGRLVLYGGHADTVPLAWEAYWGYLAFPLGKGRRTDVYPHLSLSGRAGTDAGSGGTACTALITYLVNLNFKKSA